MLLRGSQRGVRKKPEIRKARCGGVWRRKLTVFGSRFTTPRGYLHGGLKTSRCSFIAGDALKQREQERIARELTVSCFLRFLVAPRIFKERKKENALLLGKSLKNQTGSKSYPVVLLDPDRSLDFQCGHHPRIKKEMPTGLRGASTSFLESSKTKGLQCGA